MAALDPMLAAARQNAFAAFAARFPADPARVFIEAADGRQVSYGDVLAQTARLAGLLRSMGVGPGDRLALVAEKSPESILVYLACCRVGAVFVPIHIGLAWPEIEYILADAEPGVLVCAPELAEASAAWGRRAGRGTFTLDAQGDGTLMQAARSFPPDAETAAGTAADANAIVYTSGTTGRPKGAVMTNGLVVWNALALAARWGIEADDVLLHANPMAFGLFGTTTPILCAGARLKLLPKFDADAVIDALPGVTLFAGVPTYYSRLLAQPRFTADACRGVRLFITGSAPMRADLFEAFADRTGHRLLDRYGSTEGLIVTSMSVEGQRTPDRSGWPLAGSQVRIVDQDGAPVPSGTVGAIELHQPFMFAGYWKAPEKTQAAFTADGWFVTGDFGRQDADGALCVLGRGVDLVITGGLNVYPKEVETRLNALPGVVDSAVIGVPHPDFGEAVVAVVQTSGPFTPALAQAALAREMARYKVPKHIEVVEDLPRNTLGKVQKTLLKSRLQHLFAAAP